VTLSHPLAALSAQLTESEKATLLRWSGSDRFATPAALIRFTLTACSAPRRRTLAPRITETLLTLPDPDAALLLTWLAQETDLRTCVMLTDAVYTHLVHGGLCSASYEAAAPLAGRALTPKFLRRLPPRTRTRFLRLLPKEGVRLLLTFDHHLLVPGDGHGLADSLLETPFAEHLTGFLNLSNIPEMLRTALPITPTRNGSHRPQICEAQGFAERLLPALPVSSWYAATTTETIASLAASAVISAALDAYHCATPGCLDSAQQLARASLLAHLAPEWDGSLESLAELTHTMICNRAAA
jgi:hypothetical protein